MKVHTRRSPRADTKVLTRVGKDRIRCTSLHVGEKDFGLIAKNSNAAQFPSLTLAV